MAKEIMTALVQNVPHDMETYVVARYVDGEYWYYGSWDDEDRASEVAAEIGGVVLENR